MVESLGHVVTAEAGYLTEALECAKTATFDLAILDINLGSYNSLAVAKVVAARRLRTHVAPETMQKLKSDATRRYPRMCGIGG